MTLNGITNHLYPQVCTTGYLLVLNAIQLVFVRNFHHEVALLHIYIYGTLENIAHL